MVVMVPSELQISIWILWYRVTPVWVQTEWLLNDGTNGYVVYLVKRTPLKVSSIPRLYQLTVLPQRGEEGHNLKEGVQDNVKIWG